VALVTFILAKSDMTFDELDRTKNSVEMRLKADRSVAISEPVYHILSPQAQIPGYVPIKSSKDIHLSYIDVKFMTFL